MSDSIGCMADSVPWVHRNARKEVLPADAVGLPATLASAAPAAQLKGLTAKNCCRVCRLHHTTKHVFLCFSSWATPHWPGFPSEGARERPFLPPRSGEPWLLTQTGPGMRPDIEHALRVVQRRLSLAARLCLGPKQRQASVKISPSRYALLYFGCGLWQPSGIVQDSTRKEVPAL